MKKTQGFTLIELMVVVVIIGILASIAIPQFSKYRDRAYRAEGHSLGGALRKDISEYYDNTGRLPAENLSLGLPDPASIRGKYVHSMAIRHGTVEIGFGSEIKSPIAGKICRLVPSINPDYPTGPLRWEWVFPE